MDQDVTHKLISEAIGADHQYIDLCATELRNATTNDDKIRWRNQITWTFARHAISEELTMYPALEKHLGLQGKELVAVDLEQHQAVRISLVPQTPTWESRLTPQTQIKEDLYKLQSLDPAHADFTPLLDRLMDDFHHHVEHEKNEDMPALEAKLSREESNKLAIYWQQTKKMTPTRSHPSAPNRPYAENLAGLLAMPIDKIGDWVRSFPKDTKM